MGVLRSDLLQALLMAAGRENPEDVQVSTPALSSCKNNAWIWGYCEGESYILTTSNIFHGPSKYLTVWNRSVSFFPMWSKQRVCYTDIVNKFKDKEYGVGVRSSCTFFSQVLLQNGADSRAKNRFGSTPIMKALDVCSTLNIRVIPQTLHSSLPSLLYEMLVTSFLKVPAFVLCFFLVAYGIWSHYGGTK